jgi:hypothetical protein
MNGAVDFVILVCMWVICMIRAILRGAVEGSAVGIEDFCTNFITYLREYQQRERERDRAAGIVVRDNCRLVCSLSFNTKFVLTIHPSSKSSLSHSIVVLHHSRTLPNPRQACITPIIVQNVACCLLSVFLYTFDMPLLSVCTIELVNLRDIAKCTPPLFYDILT